MARYFKKSYRKRSLRSRRSRYHRFNRNRRRYYRYKRSRRRSKVEYKKIEGYQTKVFDLSYGNVSRVNNAPNAPGAANIKKALHGQNNLCYAIGSGATNDWYRAIPTGTGNSQRIGAKINPVKLRIYGTVSLVNPNHQRIAETPLTIYMRCIIFQVRNGMPSVKQVNEDGFSPVSPVFDTGSGAMQSISGYRLFSEFHGKEGYTYNANAQGVTTYIPTSVIYEEELNAYTSLTKVPYRNGIGGSIKILKDKLYKLNISKNSSFSFRFKTRKPNRLVWPEDTENPNAMTFPCKNPIYITWWMIPTTQYAYARFINDENQSIYNEGSGVIHLDFGYNMFYTDS